jgi:hypothetical protein
MPERADGGNGTPAGLQYQHELSDGRRLALGRPRVKRDERTLKLARYLMRPNLPPPGERLNLSHFMGSTPWGMYENDKYGDCTCATVAHETMLDAAMIGESRIPTIEDVLGLYRTVSKLEGEEFDNSDPNNVKGDNGAVELDVLNLWRHEPFAGVKLHAYAAVNPDDADLVRISMQLMGGLYIGIALPQTAQDQVGKLWDDMGDAPGSEPNSWGGHAVNAVDFDFTSNTPTVTVVTWGGLQLMTWRFWQRYVDESYATLTEAWTQRAPYDQFNFALLQQDLSGLGSVNPR